MYPLLYSFSRCSFLIFISDYFYFPFLFFFFFYCYGDHRDLPVLTPSFPTRRSSDLWPLPPTVRAGRTMTHKKSPAGRGGRRGSWERDLGSGLRSRGSLQGRERSVTDIASVTGYMTTRHMDSS